MATETPAVAIFIAGRIQDGSADSPVRAFLAPDPVRADKAVRAPISPFLESALSSLDEIKILLTNKNASCIYNVVTPHGRLIYS